MITLLKNLSPLIVAFVVWLLPAPSGLSPQAMQYLAVFVGVVAALIVEPVPAALAGLMGVVLAGSLNLVPDGTGAFSSKASMAWVLSGFGNDTVWLIFIAFMFALGYERTGLGKRIALILMRLLGKRTLGMGYAVAIADLILAPFIPSNTARSGGTIYPIVSNIPTMYGSSAENDPRKIGAYLMWTCLATTTVTSSLFFTGLAPNLLAMSVVKNATGLEIAWMEWFTAMLPVGVILFLATPLVAYLLYPPTQKISPETPAWAAAELSTMGSMSLREVFMGLLAVGALLMWIFGGKLMSGTMVALIALCLMVLLGVVSWKEVIGNAQAWNVLVWFATLVALADGLGRVGFLKWFTSACTAMMQGYELGVIMFGLLAVFYFSHYFFASVTAHVTAMLPILLTAAAGVPGMNLKLFAMMLCGTLGIMGIITPYGTGPSPIYYGSGYVGRTAFWTLGGVFGVLYFAVYVLIGIPWMKTLF